MWTNSPAIAGIDCTKAGPDADGRRWGKIATAIDRSKRLTKGSALPYSDEMVRDVQTYRGKATLYNQNTSATGLPSAGGAGPPLRLGHEDHTKHQEPAKFYPDVEEAIPLSWPV